MPNVNRALKDRKYGRIINQEDLYQHSMKLFIVFHHAARLVFFEKKCKKCSARNILLQSIIRSKSKNKTILY